MLFQGTITHWESRDPTMIFDDDTPEISEQTQDGVAESAPDSTGDGAADVSELGGQVIELVADQLSEDASNITPASRFQDDLKADSLDLVELVMTFEDKFGISVPDEDYEKIVSVGDAITYIEGKMGE
jgi:acyl carrier protein